MKRKAAFLLALLIVAVLSLSCAVKIDRTFGPITLKVANIHFHQNNVYPLKGALGFEPYTFEIVYDGSGTCWIDEFGRIHAGAFATDYLLQIKVKDSKGNEGISEYTVNKLILTGPSSIALSMTTTYSNYYYLNNCATDKNGWVRTRFTISGSRYNNYFLYCEYYGYTNWNSDYDYVYDQLGQSGTYTLNLLVYDLVAGSTVTKSVSVSP